MSDPAKVKILAIIPSGFCFGLQHITVDFFSRFPGNIESHFLLSKWTSGELEKLLKEKNIGYSFSWLGMFSRKMNWPNIKMSAHTFIKLPRLYFDFARLQKKEKPDILYFANHHELLLLLPMLLFRKTKVVCHMHDPGPAIPFQKRIFKLYDKVVNRYIAISDDVRLRTIELGCAAGKIDTIHNGIVIPAAGNIERTGDICVKAGWNKDVLIIGITGQMIEKKGHMDLLKAFRVLHEKNPLARLVIGGKQQEPLYTQLVEQVSDWKMNDFVFFSGWLPDINSFFRSIDVFVLASRHDEGYGLVVAEAMANNLPVVITRSGGAVEIVEDGVTGYIVSKKDPAEMADKLYRLSVDEQTRTSFSRMAKTRIERFFNIDEQVKRLAAFLINIKNDFNVR